jgi:hypothetical protein
MVANGELDLALRLTAIECVLCQVGKIAFTAAGLTAEDVRRMRANARSIFLEEPFPGADPAMGDHVGAELADSIEALFGQIECLMSDSDLPAVQVTAS